MRFTVVRGEPDEEELAAVTTVLMALLRTCASGPPPPAVGVRRAAWSVRGGWDRRPAPTTSWSR